MALTRIVMRLARNPHAGFPDGDDRRFYVVIAPLSRAGQLLPDEWSRNRNSCTVSRFMPGAAGAEGWLSHRAGSWFFRYGSEPDGPGDPIFSLGDDYLRLGEFVTVRETEGDTLIYRITDAARGRL